MLVLWVSVHDTKYFCLQVRWTCCSVTCLSIHPEKRFFIFYGSFFSVKMLFKSMYLKWNFYCNCSKRFKNLIALTSEVSQNKLSGLCVWSGSTMQRCSRREMNCINSKKLIFLKVLYSFGSEVSDIKEHWNRGRRCQQRLVEDGGHRPPMEVRLLHSDFFQRNNNNNNKSTQQHLWSLWSLRLKGFFFIDN